MYSVEDLLISHGYKLPQNNNNTGPLPRSPTSYEPRSRHADRGSGHGALNGYEGVPGAYVYGNTRQAPARSSTSNNESRDRNQRAPEGDGGNLGDVTSLGDSLTSDSGFHDGPRVMHALPRGERDVAYWRRRGQDFSVLLDYADFRDPRAGGSGKAEGMRRPPETGRERQHRAESVRARERELALQQWRLASERKYQSLGTDVWRPATGMGRQLSDSEGERWAQEQQRPRTAEGAVPPRTKAKSQSLPRMALPAEGLQHYSTSPSGQDPYAGFRVNGHPARDPYGRHHSEGSGRERWAENGRSGVQSAPLSKPRFSRPLRPPSYEVHQQTRSSSETLSGDPAQQSRDRTPLPFRPDSRQEYYAQDSSMEPPGYIPPPSYRRQPLMRGGHRAYADPMGNYQFRGDPYQQGSGMTEVGQWFMRQTGIPWPDHQRDGRRSMPCRRQAYPGYGEECLGSVQYIPFDDPRVRHISGGGVGGSSLTDADKIRNIQNEIPSTMSAEQSSDDSAFLPPQEPFNSTDTCKSNLSDSNDNRLHSEAHGENDNSNTAADQNCNRYPADQGYTTTFQVTSSRQSSSSDQGFSEMITQVKKFEPEAQTEAAENKKNSKRKFKETMFCLVSIPINLQTNRDTVSDQNNNEKVPSLTVSPPENTVTQSQNQSPANTSSTSLELQAHSSSSSSIRSSRKAPLRKEIVDAWSLQASADKELCYAGSWPGDQYRNQETQTGSPEISRGAPPNPLIQVTHDPPPSDTTTDSGVGTDCSANYGYPMKGQKNLSPSSNSAFSRTRAGSHSGQPAKSPAPLHSAPAPPSPLRRSAPPSPSRRSAPPSPSRKSAPKPQAADGQEAFGQFLLKPVNRRPWDAIEELECFNRELEDQMTKRPSVDQMTKNPSVDQCLEDLDEAYRNILELSSAEVENTVPATTHDHKREVVSTSQLEQIPDRNLPEQQPCKPSVVTRPGLDSRSIVAAELDYREVRSAFSRPPKGRMANLNRPRGEDEADLRNFEVLERMWSDPRVIRHDIPVAKESLLRDVGLTVYTEAPEFPIGLSPESPMLTSPSDYTEMCEALQLTPPGRRVDPDKHSPEHVSLEPQSSFLVKSNDPSADSNNEIYSPSKMEAEAKKDNVVPSSERTSRIHIVKSLHFRFRADYDDNVDEVYSDNLSWGNEQTLADKHLETLLIQEKANSMPTEDLSNLYQVQCAEGIPENESIEQRAARILGIAVPVESLVVADQSDSKQAEGLSATAEREVMEAQEQSADGEAQHVRRQSEDVRGRSVVGHRWVAESAEEEAGSGEDRGPGEDRPRAESHAVAVALALPEFPPGNLPLSLPVTEDAELALSVGGGEKKSWIETLQDKLAASSSSSSSSSNSRTAPERIARMKEMHSVSRMRRLSNKGTDSAEETEEKGVEERKEVETGVEEKKEEEERKEEGNEVEERKEVEEMNEETGVEERKEEGNEVEERKEEEKEVEEMNEEETGVEERKEVEDRKEEETGVEERKEEKADEEEEQVKHEKEDSKEPEDEEEEREQQVEDEEREGEEEGTEEEKKEEEEEEKSEPKEEEVHRKPVLPPKPVCRPTPQPRSGTVAKREITLPLTFGVATTRAALEDGDVLPVSDSYDPSRVERV